MSVLCQSTNFVNSPRSMMINSSFLFFFIPVQCNRGAVYAMAGGGDDVTGRQPGCGRDFAS